MFKLKDFLDICKYTLILNLIPATHFKLFGTGTTEDWDLWKHPKHLIGTVHRYLKRHSCSNDIITRTLKNSRNSLNSIHHCIVKYIHPEILPNSLRFSSSETHWRKVEKCAMVWQVHSFDYFWNLWMLYLQDEEERDHPDCYHHKVQ